MVAAAIELLRLLGVNLLYWGPVAVVVMANDLAWCAPEPADGTGRLDEVLTAWLS